MKTLLYMCLLLTLALPLYAAEKIVTRKTLDRYRGEVRIAMPCNWVKESPIKLLGEYGDGEMRRPLDHSMAASEGDYLFVRVSDEDKMGLNLIHVEYEESQKECPHPFGKGIGAFSK